MKDEELRKQAWDFFQVQTGQRISTFNFYITLSSLLSGVMISFFQGKGELSFLTVFISVMILVLAFVFHKLDERNRELIKSAKKALMYFEKKSELYFPPDDKTDAEPHYALRFTWEEFNTNVKRKKKHLIINKHFSYTDCFNIIFILFGILGLLGLIITIIHLTTDSVIGNFGVFDLRFI